MVVALPLAGRARARCASTEECLRTIERAQQETYTISAEFVQVKHLSLLDEPLVSSGRFVFKRPDGILLKIEQPQAATVVIKGQDVHIPNLPERERQAMSMAPIAAMFSQLGAIFSGSTQALQTGFEVTADEDDATIHVKLVPRKPEWKRMFRTIDLQFFGPEYFARQIRLEDALGDTLEITLRALQRNIDVPDATFDVRP